ncbi:NAD-dependent epimerase/dehydratase family protein [Micromonospora echinofusca]|uniref:NAD-dependent epimerase/dehydratase family protein n=1 Tax=Micromonospora echinofusca TaxID=47858 RepID=A0ABS3VTF4_MICEH|nr:NAD-dependent epimerase/dehydratase family protein [Micromonospora echinofusca]MBO4207819.1 NAD-dependent epimerase/dehydratase family protein [Micromonospora echinofusca]
MPPTVLLTGATGFIGGAVLAALRTRDVRLRTLARRPVPGADGVAERMRADLTRPESLRGVCDGVDVLVHAASHVGGDPRQCRLVNEEGTARLVAEAVRAGVGRVLYVSTAGVYGPGVHRGPAEDEVTRNPGSVTSASRAAAEDHVLAAGGCVLRPHLVYGPGDRWVVPALVTLLARLPGWIDGGRPRTSLIGVRDLGRVVAALATTPTPPTPGQILHANHPQPVSIAEIGAALARQLGIRIPQGRISLAEARAHAARHGLPERHLELVGADHWYRSDRIWQVAACPPGAAFPRDLTHALPYYRPLLGTPGTATEG